MKLLSATFSATAVVLAALGTANAQSPCSSIYTRKELLSLSSSEWGTVSSVLSNMQRDGWFAWFGYLHNTYFNQIHGNSQFFPFHRRFVQDWESVGQRYNSGFIQPYWDEMRDYRTPASSQVLTSAWVGGNGQGSNWCVTNGNQAGWTMTYPSNHCFSRNFGNNGNPTSWYSPEYIQSFIQRDTSMAQFRSDIEYSLHGVVHINIGGEMYQGYSPNDWIFMLHHANLDRLWWQWQKNNQLWTMDGPNYDGSQISLSSNIAAYNEPISSVMQLGYGNMCFQY
ncbi:Di-copper centre-containing protein, partial [Martensiomyces pterosporus]